MKVYRLSTKLFLDTKLRHFEENLPNCCGSYSALEPFFNAAASQFVLGQQIPFALWLSLTPVVIGMLFLFGIMMI